MKCPHCQIETKLVGRANTESAVAYTMLMGVGVLIFATMTCGLGFLLAPMILLPMLLPSKTHTYVCPQCGWQKAG